MKKYKIVFLMFNICLPILIGIVIYYVISQDVIFVQKIDALFGREVHAIKTNIDSVFLKYIRFYLLDILWGYSLVFALYFVTGNNTAELMKILKIAFVFSAIMEILQLTSIVKGTFDVIDIIMELLAEIIAVFIIKITHKEGEKIE